MVNPHRGEVEIWLNGAPMTARLTLGALAELEAEMQAGGMVDLVERFEAGRFSTRDVLALIVAGLRGGGWKGGFDDLLAVEVGDGRASGPVVAARLAAALLARAFGPSAGG
ncbi:gene transfer agent family protein [Paracoccus sp. p4-l81]|uniref:gene transfer agent family protein n=1 Tax=Paracoccus sp. p4-l81 TaxID=3342806 RepID=UPI0035B878D5